MCSPIHEQVMREQSERLEQLVVTLIVDVTLGVFAVVLVVCSLALSGGASAAAIGLAWIALVGCVVWTGRRLDRLKVE